MLTIHRLSAGDGYKYLLRHVASGDVDRAASSALTAYYAASGYPPGKWLGSGVAGLDDGGRRLRDGDDVTEEQMAALYGRGENPLTNRPLGRPFSVFRTWRERVRARTATLNPRLSRAERAAAIEQITKDESDRKTKQAVAGFDLTFSPAKSVSALWAIADPGTQEQIVAAHHEAVRDVLALIEREAAHTRTGEAGIAQIDVRGLIGAAFDHWDTRSGDPQLHTHLVVANRVQGLDGRWRTLDGRSLYRSCVAMSEIYNDLLADKLAIRLGTEWEHRERGRNRNPAWEIGGVPDALLAEFSARTTQIEANLQTLIARHREATGRAPARAQIYALRQQATLMNRPTKDTPRPLSDLVAEWRRRAEQNARIVPSTVIADAANRSRTQPLAATQIGPETLAAYAATVVLAVQVRRSTWTRWNLLAEAARQTRALRLTTAQDRLRVLDAIADRCEHESVSLAAPEWFDVPDILRRRDGESVFTIHNGQVFTSTAVLGAEAILLDLAHTRTGPTVPPDAVDATLTNSPDDRRLSPDQAAAVRRIATSGQVLEAMIGPAGAGKTTTLAALRHTWESTHGPGTVTGLAPSAAAAEVLSEHLGIATENTAKWIHEAVGQGARDRATWITRCEQGVRQAALRDSPKAHTRALTTLATARSEADRWRLHPDQLVIVDEASLAGTTQLATLARQAAEAGAKLLLVGDDGQLSAVESGGAFRLIARDTNAATLSEIWRFQHQWERDASIHLRHGNTDAVTLYTEHDRISTGTPDGMQDAAYAAWHADEQQGQHSLMIAADNTTVAALNTRARIDRIASGAVESAGVPLRDGTEAGVGDRIVTRLNQRRIITSHHRYVRNGNEWIVTKRWSDGSLTVRGNNGDTVILPAAYVADSVELGYATTAHRAQGATVDTAHQVVTENLSREVLYVGMTRGRVANKAYVVTANSHDEEHQRRPERTARDVLEEVLQRADAERSAHEVMRSELDAACRLDRLVPIHEHMCQIAAGDRYRAALERCGLAHEHHTEMLTSPAYGPLLAALRHAESRGLSAEKILSQAVSRASLDTAKDIAAVLHGRIDRVVRRAERRCELRPETTIVGVVRPATGIADPVFAAALQDTENLIADRAEHLANRAVSAQSRWLAALGQPPWGRLDRAAWEDTVAQIAAYRERHGVRGRSPLGPQPSPKHHAHARDWRRLRDHLESRSMSLPSSVAGVDPTTEITSHPASNRTFAPS